jgi:glycosyltransferase involved in cell wall biosynthesis
MEYIIWINNRSTLEVNRLDEYYNYADIIIHDKDLGIFDAMNRALQYASGDYVMFLNARDIIIETFDLKEISGPCLVPVQYWDYFGRKRLVRVAPSMNFGIPYCHQGMILPRAGYYYDVVLKYGADYLALLDFNFNWPLPMLSSGLIEYDTTGVSTVNRWESDKWTARIIRARFGYGLAAFYLVKCLFKLGIKRIYDLKCIFFGR